MNKKETKSIRIELRDKKEVVLTAKDLKEKLEKLEMYIAKAQARQKKLQLDLEEEIRSEEKKKIVEESKKYYNLKKRVEGNV
jgi:hypothetical protein